MFNIVSFVLVMVPFCLWAVLVYMLQHKQDRAVMPRMLSATAAALAITAVCISLGIYGKVADWQILNGHVVSKSSEKVTCEHSYSCNCTTDSKGNQTCSTCYEHLYDVDWIVATSVGDVYVPRVNRQGTTEPQRWTNTIIGEPVAREATFINYIKGSPDSLFNQSQLQSSYPDLEYPHVYDLYRINRVLCQGCNVSPAVISQINSSLNLALIKLGPSLEMNIIVVFTSYPQAYVPALQAKWLGGKKNDLVIVIGKDYGSAFSWSKNLIINYDVQDRIQKLGYDPNQPDYAQKLTQEIVSASSGFHRRPMSEYSYMKSSIDPSQISIWIAVLFNTALMIWMTFFAPKHGPLEANSW